MELRLRLLSPQTSENGLDLEIQLLLGCSTTFYSWCSLEFFVSVGLLEITSNYDIIIIFAQILNASSPGVVVLDATASFLVEVRNLFHSWIP
jgi:hypothetical protein